MSWDQVIIPKATKKQRQSLYRLGFCRDYVQKLDQEQADQLIKIGVKIKSDQMSDTAIDLTQSADNTKG